MGTRTLVIVVTLLLLAAPLPSAAKYARQIVDARLVELADRDVLVLRGVDSLPEVNTYSRDQDAVTLAIPLRQVGTDDLTDPQLEPTQLVRAVDFLDDDGRGIKVQVTLSDPALLAPDCFRITHPSQGILILEVFPHDNLKQSAGYLTDIDSLLPPVTRTPGGVEPTAPGPAAAPATPEFDPDALGIATIDLRDADPERVLGLAASTGLLDLNCTAKVSTQNLGHLTVDPAGQSLVSWAAETPPDELYLCGTPGRLADFLGKAESDYISRVPTLTQVWAATIPDVRHTPTMGSRTGVDTHQRVKDDPVSGLYYAETRPQGRLLSDVRVTLPATSGLNLYDVINYLSLISGISIIVDPYTFDEPFGGDRAPLAPDPPISGESGAGYRPAGIFDPAMSSGRSGTVIGNIDNVPFDTALELILSTHELVYAVLDSGVPDSQGSRYGSPGSRDPYRKPVVLVTSRQRLEQELAGQNEIDMWLNHYADPIQMTDLLDQFGLTNSTLGGWFIYYGGGGSGYSPSGGGGGGGTGGGGGGSTSSRRVPTAGLVVHRGDTGMPVEAVVMEELERGTGMVRVLLPASETGMKVTAISR